MDTFHLLCNSQQSQRREMKKKKNLQIIRTDQLPSKEALEEVFFSDGNDKTHHIEQTTV